MSLSIAINQRELIFISGFSLLWQSLDLSPDSKLVKEGQKLLLSALSLLECETAAAAAEFGVIVQLVSPSIEGLRRNSLENSQLAQATALSKQKSSPKRHFSLKARPPPSFDADIANLRETSRRATLAGSMPNLPSALRPSSSHSAGSHPSLASAIPQHPSTNPHPAPEYLKLDFVGDGKSDWEHVLSDIESGHANIYTGIYGGSEAGETPAAYMALNGNTPPSLHPSQGRQQQAQHRQSAPSLPNLDTSSASLGGQGTTPHNIPNWTSENWSATVASSLRPTHSVVSYSEDSMASSECMSPGQVMASNHHPTSHLPYPQPPHHRSSRHDLDIEGIMIPHNLEGLDANSEYAVQDASWIPQCVI